MLVRANTAIPTWPRLRWVGERAADPLYLDIYPDAQADAGDSTIYLDDGLTEAFREGAFWRRSVSTSSTDSQLSVTLSEAEGSFTLTHQNCTPCPLRRQSSEVKAEVTLSSSQEALSGAQGWPLRERPTIADRMVST